MAMDFCILSMPRAELASAAALRQGGKSMYTLMAEVHFHLQGLELVGQAGTGLCAHLLVGPLLEAIEFLVDIHSCGDQGKGASVAQVVRTRAGRERGGGGGGGGGDI